MRSKTGLSIQFLFIYLFFVYKYEHCQKCAHESKMKHLIYALLVTQNLNYKSTLAPKNSLSQNPLLHFKMSHINVFHYTINVIDL